MTNLATLRNIDGVLLLDKPKGISSNHALQKIKRLYRAKKAGHCGSLDPLATGMLPLCFGQATKFSQYLLDARKHYIVTAQLGIKTTTGDAEGEIIARCQPVNIDESTILRTLPAFFGEITQVPPIYSALKFQGQPLYRLARKGIQIEPKSRQVIIYSLNLLSYEKDLMILDVHCSKGTYIRSLIEDIGESLGTGASVIELRRLDAGHFHEKSMFSVMTLETIFEQKGIEGIESLLMPIDALLENIPAKTLSFDAAQMILQGKKIELSLNNEKGVIRLYTEQEKFLGLGYITEENQLIAKRLMNSTLLNDCAE